MGLFKKKETSNKLTSGSPNSPQISGASKTQGPRPSPNASVFANVVTNNTASDVDNMGKLIHPEKLYDDKPNTTNFPLIVPNDPFLHENRIFHDSDFMGSFKRKASAKTNIKIDKGTKIDREGWLVKEGRVVKSWKKRWFILSGNTLAYYTAKRNKIKGSIPLDTCIIRIAKNRTGTEHLQCLELINTAISENAATTGGDEDDEDDEKEEESVRTLFFDAADERERHEWFVAITNKIALLKYQRQMRALKRKDDPRVIHLFDTPTLKELDLSFESDADEPENTAPASPRSPRKANGLHHEIMVAIKEPIRLSISLQSINFENAGIGNNGLKELAEALRENKSVNKVNLSGNAITETGITSLAATLSVNSTLTNIDLSNNALSDDAIKILCEQALKVAKNTNLKRLSLNHNMIGDKGIEYYVDALITNTKLNQIEVLELSHNQIGDVGCESLAKLIDFQTQNADVVKMTLIDIGYNNIGNDGAKSISKSMSLNKNIRGLNLEFNQIGYQGTKDLAFCCVKNTKIEKLVLGGNRLGEQALYLLANTSMSFPQFMLTSK
jgi:hypothetical protein